MAVLLGLTHPREDILNALRAVEWDYPDWEPQPVVRVPQRVVVGVNLPRGRTAMPARWGFAMGRTDVGVVQDDRVETNRLFSSMLGRSPALFPASGVYVEGGDGGTHWMRRRDGRPIVIPGLASVREVGRSEELCAVMLVTEANVFHSQFSPRQVCALRPEEVDEWMYATTTDEALRFLHPPAEEDWEAVPVAGVPAADGEPVPVGEPVRA